MQSSAKSQRKLKNFVINPKFQFRFVAYLFFFGVFFGVAVQWMIFSTMRDAIIEYYTNAKVGESVWQWLDPSIVVIGPQFLGLVAINAVICFGFGIFITHKIAGPAVAIKRQINKLKEGMYGVPCALREGDSLEDIAEELTALSETLERKHGTIMTSKHSPQVYSINSDPMSDEIAIPSPMGMKKAS